MRVRAPPAVVAAAPVAPVARVVPGLAVVGCLLVGAHAVPVDPGQNGSGEEEDAVHDAKGEARLEHSARLVDRNVEAVDTSRAEDAECDIVRVADSDVGAVGTADEAQIVDASDKSSDKAKINGLAVNLAKVSAEARRKFWLDRARTVDARRPRSDVSCFKRAMNCTART